MQREVGAATSGTWLGNDDTRLELARLGLGLTTGSEVSAVGSCLEAGAALREVLELSNDDQLWAFASGQLVDGSWVVCHGKSELLAALLPCSATISHGSVSCLCSAALCRLVSLSGALFGISLG